LLEGDLVLKEVDVRMRRITGERNFRRTSGDNIMVILTAEIPMVQLLVARFTR
jgi:hypothetical protein